MSPSEGISLEAHGCRPGLLGLLTLQALISQSTSTTRLSSVLSPTTLRATAGPDLGHK